MYVAVASRNPNKVRAVETAYMTFGIPAKVITVDKPSVIPRQPVGLTAVVSGAMSRAKHATQWGDHGVGIEAGVVEVESKHLDVTIAAIVDKSGVVTLGIGAGFQIPPMFLEKVLNGVELGDVAEKVLKTPAVGYRQGLVGVLTRGRVTRFDLNYMAVTMALIPRLPYNNELYGSGARI